MLNQSIEIVNSFDLFDTLVIRKCEHPHDVHRIVEKSLGFVGFCKERLRAEIEISHTEYSLTDIYLRVQKNIGLSNDESALLMGAELDTEYEMLFPSPEICAKVKVEDLIISDMYLPLSFISRIVSEKCRLPFNRVILTVNGKRNGTVWTELKNFKINNHYGDNEETDVRSPSKVNINAIRVLPVKQTRPEEILSSYGFHDISGIVKKALVSMPAVNKNGVINAQVGCNVPLLVMSSYALISAALQNGWNNILFSSRDCYIYKKVFEILLGKLRYKINTSYFWTSRVSRMTSSHSYIDYCSTLLGKGQSVVVDLCGTGRSLNYLQLKIYPKKFDIFLMHYMDIPDLEKSYSQLTHLLTGKRVKPNYFIDGTYDNNVLEIINSAQHPMVTDVMSFRSVPIPVFAERNDSLEAQLDFKESDEPIQKMLDDLCALDEKEYSRMQYADWQGCGRGLYSELGTYRQQLSSQLQPAFKEDAKVWAQLREHFKA